MRNIVLFLILTMALAGCADKRSKDLASCELEEMKLMPAQHGYEKNDAPFPGTFVRTCMASKDYEFSSEKDCWGSTIGHLNGSCYKDKASFWVWLFDFKKAIFG